MAKISSKVYDFVIIGSGLGGLECAYILSSEGYSVCVLEKNHQIGGNLQVFSRDKCIFDTGVHYVGGLDEGENLNQFFKYFGLMDKLKLKRMDSDGFDIIRLKDGKEYRYAQGYDNFKKNLIVNFPDEELAIDSFCKKMQEVCRLFPLYNLESESEHNYLNEADMMEEKAYDYIASITDNEDLQNVLAGSNPLYAGVKDKSPFYVHALILNSYITGSYKLIDGGSQIAILLSRSIRKFGGEIHKRKTVIGANYDGKNISEVILESGEIVKGKNFISNAHPALTIDIFGEKNFLKVYRKRIKGLENTMSTFIVHLVLEENTFPYLNHNIYHYDSNDVWETVDYDESTWPQSYFICTPATSKSDVFADSMSVMVYMRYEEMKEWDNSYNTIAKPSERGEAYEQFKRLKEQKVIDKLEAYFPEIKSKIKSVHSSTPLTFKDYIGSPDGSLYGVLKDANNSIKTLINPKTKVPNLYLTGQNIIFHGILGVTIGAFVTCSNFVNKTKLINKVKNA